MIIALFTVICLFVLAVFFLGAMVAYPAFGIGVGVVIIALLIWGAYIEHQHKILRLAQAERFRLAENDRRNAQQAKELEKKNRRQEREVLLQGGLEEVIKVGKSARRWLDRRSTPQDS